MSKTVSSQTDIPQDDMLSQQEVDARYLASLDRRQARELLEAMRNAVNEVPSYVEVQGMKNWIANRLNVEVE